VQTIAPCFGVYKRDFYTPTLKRIHFDSQSEALYCDCEESDTDCCLWSKESGYAKILSYKTPRFEITREQILELDYLTNSISSQSIREKLRNLFPSVFEVKVDYNKPLLSLNDLLSVWGDINEVELYKTSPLFKSFEELSKTKSVQP